MMEEKNILQEILNAGLVTKAQIRSLEEHTKKHKVSVYDAIAEKGYIPDSVIGQIIADLCHVPFIDLKKRSIHENTLRIIPEVVARTQLVIPFSQDDQNIFCAMFDPSNSDIISYIEKMTGKRVTRYFATKENITETLRLYKTQLKADLDSLLRNKKLEGKLIIDLLNTVIEYAFVNRASDIHIEPLENIVIIRFRIDGELHDVAELSLSFLDEVVSRVKVLAQLRTDEHKSAQDGKFHFEYEEQEADIRVSVVPITSGEKIVMRILSEQSRSFNLEELGFGDEHLALVQQNSERPYGMILATGPTGSGKTSTLYAIVKKINSRSVNISTIEDPVEYDIDGINQIQVNPRTNLTFAHGLRAILRQDPDIIMVGEIRDNETAKIAINAAMTGHLVLSTLHTNDAPTALPRLLDMDIEPFLIASTINLIIAQRLVRKICSSCIQSYIPKEKEIGRLLDTLTPQERGAFQKNAAKIRFFQGKGCDVCHKTGYDGRIGIFEILEVSEQIRTLIMKRASSDEVRAQARKEKMHSMFFDGLKKVIEGKTTIEEVLKATSV